MAVQAVTGWLGMCLGHTLGHKPQSSRRAEEGGGEESLSKKVTSPRDPPSGHMKRAVMDEDEA